MSWRIWFFNEAKRFWCSFWIRWHQIAAAKHFRSDPDKARARIAKAFYWRNKRKVCDYIILS